MSAGSYTGWMATLRTTILALLLSGAATLASAQSGGVVTTISRMGEQCYENFPRDAFDAMERLAPGLFEAYPSTTSCASLGMGVYAGTMEEDPSIRVYTTSESNAFLICATGGLGNCAIPAPVAGSYTDLWWNPAESGWGLSVTHHSTGVAFLAWYVYDGAGNPKWYVASACRISARACTDTLYEATGPAFPGTFNPSQVKLRAVGTITLRFTDLVNGSFTYSIDGATGTKTIRRQSF